MKRTPSQPKKRIGTASRMISSNDLNAVPRVPSVRPEFAPCILVPESDFAEFYKLLSSYLPVFAIKRNEGDYIILIDSNGSEFEIRTAPMLCLGLFASSKTGLPTLEAARVLLNSWSDCDLPRPQVITDSQSNNGLSVLLATSLVDRLHSYATQITRLNRELLWLRSAHEDTLNAFADVEAFITASGSQPLNMTFEAVPIAGHAVPASPYRAITQLLPVSTFGLSIVELHLQDSLAANQQFGGLTIEVRSLEDQQIHQAWHIPLDELQPGWLTLALSTGLAGPQRTPLLTIRPLGDFGLMPPISLGEIQPLRSYRPRAINAQGEEIEVADRSLALRTWSGLPGVRPPNLNMKKAGNSKVYQIPIPFTMFRNVRQISHEWTRDFNPVKYAAEERGLLCHPPPSGETWGELCDFPVSDQPFRLSVRATIRSAKSKPVEFGLAIATNKLADVRKAAQNSHDVSRLEGVCFSGWHRVVHGEQALLSILINAVKGAPGSVLFGTRMAEKGGNAYAWAHFTNLQKTLLGGDAPASQKEMPVKAETNSISRSEPIMALTGGALSVDVLQAVENALNLEMSGVPLVIYDPDRGAILCHPPNEGITLARLSKVSLRNPFRLIAHLQIGNEKSKPVDFCLVISSLPTDRVVGRLLKETKRSKPAANFVSTGWHSVAYGRDVPIEIDSLLHQGDAAYIFLATRMGDVGATNEFAWAYICDIRIETDAVGPRRLIEKLSV